MTKISFIPSKLMLSSDCSEKLHFLSQRLNLRRNIICRLAIAYSLNHPKSVKSFLPGDNDGLEFNLYTITGGLDNVYRALIVQHEGKRIDDRAYFSIFLRNHIERGVHMLQSDFQKINSPVDFLTKLVDRAQKIQEINKEFQNM